MKANAPKLLATIGAVIGMSVLLGVPAAAAQCLDNRAIQDAIASGEIAPVSDILAANGVGADEQVLSVKVCEDGGGLVYVIAVLGPDGDARNLTLPAS